MRSRKELSPILHEIMASKYKNFKVYWQPPTNTKVTYPCVIYERSAIDTDYGDNLGYKNMVRYTITLIGKEPDNDDLIEKLLDIPYASFDRRFITDNLYHDVFDLYF